MLELGSHDGRAVHHPVKYRLVDDCFEAGRILGAEKLLPDQPPLYALLDHFGPPLGHRRADNRPGVVGGLEEAWYEAQAKVADGLRVRLKTYVSGIWQR